MTLNLKVGQRALVFLEGRQTRIILIGERVDGMVVPTVGLSDLPVEVYRMLVDGINLAAYNKIEGYSSVANEPKIPSRVPVIRCIEGQPLVLKTSKQWPQGMKKLTTRKVLSITIY